jgi:hypothetical protein
LFCDVLTNFLRHLPSIPEQANRFHLNRLWSCFHLSRDDIFTHHAHALCEDFLSIRNWDVDGGWKAFLLCLYVQIGEAMPSERWTCFEANKYSG